MSDWKPEIVVEPALARELIDSQFPELRGTPLRRLAEGWDNVVYQLGEEWLFRFPQRQMAVAFIEREIRTLPGLSPLLSAPIPVPRWLGNPQGRYPWPFFGYKPVPGVEACERELSVDAYIRLADDLGRLLSRLHGREIYSRFRTSLPEDPIGRMDFVGKRREMSRKRLSALRELGETLPEAELLLAVDRATEIPPLPKSSLVHGDLHFRHILLDPDDALSGLIDWGDLHLNDPALDLQIYWSFFPPQARSRFESAYGGISPERKALARGVAVYINGALLEYGIREGLDSIAREARHALELTACEGP